MKVLSNERIPMERFSFNTCNSEFVTTSGEVHVVTKELPGGGTETTLTGSLKGVGSLGNAYVLHLNETITLSGPSAVSSTSRELLVSKGGSANQLTQSTFTYPPIQFDAEVGCRG